MAKLTPAQRKVLSELNKKGHFISLVTESVWMHPIGKEIVKIRKDTLHSLFKRGFVRYVKITLFITRAYITPQGREALK